MQNTELGLTKAEKVIIHLIPPILGAVTGWFLPAIAGWILKLSWLSWLPYQDIIGKIASYSGMTASVILSIAGIAAGIILSQFIFHETLRLFVNEDSVTLRIKNTKDNFRKADIQSVYMEGKHLVFTGNQENEMFKERYDGNKKLLAQTFLSFGYPWSDSDPYQAAYRRWDEDDLHIPQAAHALLRARKGCLDNDQETIAKQIRLDLARIGVAVKDRNDVQYVRLDQSLLQHMNT